MKKSRENSFLLFLIIFLTMTPEVALFSQPVSEEYIYKRRDNRFEGIKRGTPIAGEKLELLSAVIKYQQTVPLKPIKKLNIGFFLNKDESNVDVTVMEYDKRYYMEPLKKEYKSGFREFPWDANIINALKIDLHALYATVKVRGIILAPAILYYAKLPDTLKVEAYQFVFVPSVKGDVEWKIVHNEKIAYQDSLKAQPAKQQTPITWNCKDASEGRYKLLITFRFKPLFKPWETINISYEFYHKPELNPQNLSPEIPH